MRQTTTNRRIGLVLALVCALVTAVPQPSAYATHEDGYAHDGYGHRQDDGRYVFATTRGLNELDMHPAFKLPVWPVAFILDLVFLPFAALADATNH